MDGWVGGWMGVRAGWQAGRQTGRRSGVSLVKDNTYVNIALSVTIKSASSPWTWCIFSCSKAIVS